MDSGQRVTALKKAYADIILNTAKEAAARVMVSERKAQRFEHELKVAKEEGLRMMLRIKQRMDAKVSEAELTILSQKKNIDELEAQLHEAEDIVRDLREELREVQSELDRLKRDKAQRLEKSYISTHGQLEINRLYTSQLTEFRPQESYSGSIFSHTMGHALNDHRTASHNCYRTSIYRGYSNGGSPDLPAIISRRKEPLFYRNGCTQRILACEKDRIDQEFSLCKSINNTKDEISIKEVEGGNRNTSNKKVIKDNCHPDCSPVNKIDAADNPLKNETLSEKNTFGESTRTDEALPCSSPKSASDDTHSDDDRSETSPRVLSIKGGPRMNSDCSGNSGSLVNLIRCSTDQGSENRHARLTQEMEQQKMECEEISDIMDPAKGSASSIELGPNVSESRIYLPKPTINDNYFKYTFQRKRKRNSLVNENEPLENNLPEEYIPVGRNKIFAESCDVKSIISLVNGKPKVSTSDTITAPGSNNFSRDVAEEQNNSIHLPKPCVIESLQDNVGLLQVTHQLISMPEKVGSTLSTTHAE